MNADELVNELQDVRKFFERSISVLDDADGNFCPKADMFTVAQHVFHVAQTVHWAIEGAFGSGWDMNFEQHEKETREVSSLTEARAALARSFENAQVVIRSQAAEQLDEKMPSDSPIMAGKPRYQMIRIINDHTAHHRGALTVYTRLLDKVPPMPYI